MNRLKRPVAMLLRLLANRIVQHRILKHLAFRVLTSLPRSLQGRLRRLAAPGAQISPPSAQTSRMQQLLSHRAERTFLDLKRRLQAPQPSVQARPRLAFVSPLPPERSGISDYSAILLPELARHYCIEVIVDQQVISDPWIEANCPVRRVEWFRAHAHEFDRVVYQFGNSLFHAHMFALLEDIPGVVVLHDFFLGHVVANIDAAHPDSGFLPSCLYDSLGYGSLLDYANGEGVQRVIWENPCNLPVLTAATGVIVHSRYSKILARQFYPILDSDQWAEIALPRLPAGQFIREQARQQLKLPEKAHLVCSFGHLTTTKLSDRLLDAWVDSALASDPDCWLVFVGDSPVNGLGPVLESRIRSHKLSSRVRITGWVDAEHYQLYQQAADVGVQLRSQSRGETSAAALDCMNHGLATIVNANGSMADLPPQAVLILEDKFDLGALTTALESLRHDSNLRQRLGKAASDHIQTHHHPVHCAAHYHRAIENFYFQREICNQATLDPLLTELQDLATNDQTLAVAATTLARTLPSQRGQRQLLVDVSALARSDLKTGIERVARAQLLCLIDAPPVGFRVEPVYLVELENQWHYCYARRYARQTLGLHNFRQGDEIVDVDSGDILYIPDFFAQGVINAERSGLYRQLKDQGLRLHVLVHDLLPITLPTSFPPGADETHRQWLAAISEFADQLICISHAVAKDVESLRPKTTAQIAVLHHGADINASAPTGGLPRRARKILHTLKGAPTLLMVGTIEPRKGHLQVIAALELLWQRGMDINLVVVGNEGWKPLEDTQRRTIPEIVRRLEGHSQRGRKLFWLAGISDQYLEALYDAASCLIAASEGEGFGLPLVEAAQHGLPVIARDIPVFREVAGHSAHYFNGSEPEILADAIENWLSLHKNGQVPDSKILHWQTWAENASQLKQLLTDNAIPLTTDAQ